jgi:hypothetical protein
MATNAQGTRATPGTPDVETGAGTTKDATIETVIAIDETGAEIATVTETEIDHDAQNHDLGRDTETLK